MSTPIAFHIMFALLDRRVIFRTPAERAEGVRRLIRIGSKFGLLLFHLGSDHVHVVVCCSPAELPRFAHAIECSWTHLLGDGPGFAHYHAKAVTDQGHLERLVRYVFLQDEHHEQALDPFHLGSNAPELCGGRLDPSGLGARFARLLPRMGPRNIEKMLLGEPLRPPAMLGPAPAGLTGEALERQLRSAAAAAVGEVDLRRRAAHVAEARAALLRVCEQTDLGRTVDLARLLRCRPKHLPHLRRREVSVEVTRAVRWQVSFRLQRIECRTRRG